MDTPADAPPDKPNPTDHPLRAWRKDQGLSLRALAGRLAEADVGGAVSYSILARVERGQLAPSFELLLALLELSGGELRLDAWVPAEVRGRLAGAAGDGLPERVVRRGVVA